MRRVSFRYAGACAKLLPGLIPGDEMDNQTGIGGGSNSPVEYELGIIERAEEISPATVGLTIAEG
jgi:hypothetical protein